MHLQIEQAQAGGAGGLDTGGVDTVSEVGTQHSEEALEFYKYVIEPLYMRFISKVMFTRGKC